MKRAHEVKWIITVGGDYGSFEFTGTEEQAEAMRRHKANWEHAVATKRRVECIDEGKGER